MQSLKKIHAWAQMQVPLYERNQLHRYILCIVAVILCNEHWEQGIQIEMKCNSKLFSL